MFARSDDVEAALTIIKRVNFDSSLWSHAASLLATELARLGDLRRVLMIIDSARDKFYAREVVEKAVIPFLVSQNFEAADALIFRLAAVSYSDEIARVVYTALADLVAAENLEHALIVANRYRSYIQPPIDRYASFNVNLRDTIFVYGSRCAVRTPRFVNSITSHPAVRARLLLGTALAKESRLLEAEQLIGDVPGAWNQFVLRAAFANAARTFLGAGAATEMLRDAASLASNLADVRLRLFALSTMGKQLAHAGLQAESLNALEQAQEIFWTQFRERFWVEHLPSFASDIAAAGVLEALLPQLDIIEDRSLLDSILQCSSSELVSKGDLPALFSLISYVEVLSDRLWAGSIVAEAERHLFRRPEQLDADSRQVDDAIRGHIDPFSLFGCRDAGLTGSEIFSTCQHVRSLVRMAAEKARLGEDANTLLEEAFLLSNILDSASRWAQLPAIGGHHGVESLSLFATTLLDDSRWRPRYRNLRHGVAAVIVTRLLLQGEIDGTWRFLAQLEPHSRQRVLRAGLEAELSDEQRWKFIEAALSDRSDLSRFGSGFGTGLRQSAIKNIPQAEAETFLRSLIGRDTQEHGKPDTAAVLRLAHIFFEQQRVEEIRQLIETLPLVMAEQEELQLLVIRGRLTRSEHAVAIREAVSVGGRRQRAIALLTIAENMRILRR
jgi:hypothetical protein